MLEPQRQLCDDGFGVRNGVHRDVVALECFDKSLGQCVGLGAVNRRRARLHADVDEQCLGIPRYEARTVVGQPFEWLWKGADETEAALDSRNDKVPNVLAHDAFSGGDMGDGLAITAVESQGNADFFLVVPSDLEAV